MNVSTLLPSVYRKRSLDKLTYNISNIITCTTVLDQGEIVLLAAQPAPDKTRQDRQDILFHNQEKLASVLNKTKQEAQVNQQNIQKIHKDVSALNQALGESIRNAERISAYMGMMDSISQLEMIHQLTTQRDRIDVATLEAIRNGHLTEDVLSNAQLGEVMRMMTCIGWMLPTPWVRTFSPVQAVSENKAELTAMCVSE